LRVSASKLRIRVRSLEGNSPQLASAPGRQQIGGFQGTPVRRARSTRAAGFGRHCHSASAAERQHPVSTCRSAAPAGLPLMAETSGSAGHQARSCIATTQGQTAAVADAATQDPDPSIQSGTPVAKHPLPLVSGVIPSPMCLYPLRFAQRLYRAQVLKAIWWLWWFGRTDPVDDHLAASAR
jgi:hypothetical protein